MKKSLLVLCLRRLIAVFAVFAAVISALMISDYINAKRLIKDVDSTLLEMRDSITKSPNDENLKSDFVRLELLYRRAVFADADTRKVGLSLLFFSLFAVAVSSAILIQKREPKLEPPNANSARERLGASALFRRVAAGAFLLLLCAGLGVILLNYAWKSRGSKSELRAQFAELKELDKSWTSFRGPRNDGLARNADFSGVKGLEKAWEVELWGDGFNSPLCVGDKVLVASADENTRSILCFSKNDGSLLWRADSSAKLKSNYDEQSGPSPSTMACDGFRAYAIFPTGELICSDMSGKVLYVKNFGTPEILYSYSSSLLICGNSLIVQMDLEKTRTLYALEASSGAILWKCENGKDVSWSSPSLVEFEGEKYVVTANCKSVEAVNLKDGKVKFSTECLSGEMATSIAFGDGILFVANDNSAASAIDFKTGKVLWSNDSIILPGVASPVYSDGELYVFTSGGTVSRVEAKTGKLIKEYESMAGFYSSPIIVGGKIVACDNEGKLFLLDVKSDMDFESPAFDFADTLYATPAIAADSLFVRAGKKLYRLNLVK